ncbi:unnamed protein product, partial [Chrysoparadoxa australica]
MLECQVEETNGGLEPVKGGSSLPSWLESQVSQGAQVVLQSPGASSLVSKTVQALASVADPGQAINDLVENTCMGRAAGTRRTGRTAIGEEAKLLRSTAMAGLAAHEAGIRIRERYEAARNTAIFLEVVIQASPQAAVAMGVVNYIRRNALPAALHQTLRAVPLLLLVKARPEHAHVTFADDFTASSMLPSRDMKVIGAAAVDGSSGLKASPLAGLLLAYQPALSAAIAASFAASDGLATSEDCQRLISCAPDVLIGLCEPSAGQASALEQYLQSSGMYKTLLPLLGTMLVGTAHRDEVLSRQRMEVAGICYIGAARAEGEGGSPEAARKLFSRSRRCFMAAMPRYPAHTGSSWPDMDTEDDPAVSLWHGFVVECSEAPPKVDHKTRSRAVALTKEVLQQLPAAETQLWDPILDLPPISLLLAKLLVHPSMADKSQHPGFFAALSANAGCKAELGCLHVVSYLMRCLGHMEKCKSDPGWSENLALTLAYEALGAL